MSKAQLIIKRGRPEEHAKQKNGINMTFVKK
jgi:hypothetical protein